MLYKINENWKTLFSIGNSQTPEYFIEHFNLNMLPIEYIVNFYCCKYEKDN